MFKNTTQPLFINIDGRHIGVSAIEQIDIYHSLADIPPDYVSEKVWRSIVRAKEVPVVLIFGSPSDSEDDGLIQVLSGDKAENLIKWLSSVSIVI